MTSPAPDTLHAALCRLREAADALLCEMARVLGIHKLLRWISR